MARWCPVCVVQSTKPSLLRFRLSEQVLSVVEVKQTAWNGLEHWASSVDEKCVSSASEAYSILRYINSIIIIIVTFEIC